MLHIENNINSLAKPLQSLLKLFSMFNVRIRYNEAIVTNNVPDDIGINCINCGKNNGCLLDNQAIEN